MTLSLATTEATRTQALWVEERLREAGVVVEVETVDSAVDPGAGPLTSALTDGTAELALVPGPRCRGLDVSLTCVAVMPREEVRDLLVVARGAPTPLRSLPKGVRVGVAGARRRALLRAHRADADVVTLENGTTPAQALAAGTVDAVVLSAWEARNSGLATSASEMLDPKMWLPSPGQGAAALVGRVGFEVPDAVLALDDAQARASLRAELALLDTLDVPFGSTLGALAQPTGRWIRLWAAAASEDGRAFVRADRTGPSDEPEVVARLVAHDLVERGLAGVLSGGGT